MEIENVRRAPVNSKDFAYEGLRLAEANDEEAIRALQAYDETILSLEIQKSRRALQRIKFPLLISVVATVAVIAANQVLPGTQSWFFWVFGPVATVTSALLLKLMGYDDDARHLRQRMWRLNDLYILAMRLRMCLDEASILGSEVRQVVDPPPIPTSGE